MHKKLCEKFVKRVLTHKGNLFNINVLGNNVKLCEKSAETVLYFFDDSKTGLAHVTASGKLFSLIFFIKTSHWTCMNLIVICINES